VPGLRRSLAVAPQPRSLGLGARRAACAEAPARADGRGKEVGLSETAEDFFVQFGYRVLGRRQTPAGIRAGSDFRTLCPASAICMRKALP
jgi:amino-acid N-acetyltransferase